MNGDREVKGNEHTTHVRDVIDQFVRWYLSGTFRPRDDESCWCRHVLRESNKAADTHANWLMDNGDSRPDAQWKRRDYREKTESSETCRSLVRWSEKRKWRWCGSVDIVDTNYEWFERISHGGKVLMDTTAMNAEREALRLGVGHLMSLFPVEAKDFQLVENESRETKYKVDTQSMRLFGLLNDHTEDVHRADANRLGEEKSTLCGQTTLESELENGTISPLSSKVTFGWYMGDFSTSSCIVLRTNDSSFSSVLELYRYVSFSSSTFGSSNNVFSSPQRLSSTRFTSTFESNKNVPSFSSIFE